MRRSKKSEKKTGYQHFLNFNKHTNRSNLSKLSSVAYHHGRRDIWNWLWGKIKDIGAHPGTQLVIEWREDYKLALEEIISKIK